MPFIISKTSKRHGRERKLYYFVENYRNDNRVKRETLLKLGENKNLQEHLEFAENKEVEAKKRLERSVSIFEGFKYQHKVPVLMAHQHPSRIWKNLNYWVEKDKKEVERWQNYQAQIRSYL